MPNLWSVYFFVVTSAAAVGPIVLWLVLVRAVVQERRTVADRATPLTPAELTTLCAAVAIAPLLGVTIGAGLLLVPALVPGSGLTLDVFVEGDSKPLALLDLWLLASAVLGGLLSLWAAHRMFERATDAVQLVGTAAVRAKRWILIVWLGVFTLILLAYVGLMVLSVLAPLRR